MTAHVLTPDAWERKGMAAAPRSKLKARLAENIAVIDRRIFDLATGRGDTPIERLFFEALYLEAKTSWKRDLHLIVRDPAVKTDPSAMGLDSSEPLKALLECQVNVAAVCVDFLLTVMERGSGAFKSLVVECDGHDFHERTKEQAQRDRARDREFQILGFQVYRFTGSEIWNDPCGCSNQVMRWIFDTMFPASNEVVE